MPLESSHSSPAHWHSSDPGLRATYYLSGLLHLCPKFPFPSLLLPPASLPSPLSSWMPTIFANRPCLLSFTPANVLRPYGGEWLTLFVTIVPVSAHPTPLHQVAMLSRHCLAPASRKCQLLRWTLPMPITSSASHPPTEKTTDALVQVGGGLSGVPICHPGPLLCAVVELCALPSDHVQNL